MVPRTLCLPGGTAAARLCRREPRRQGQIEGEDRRCNRSENGPWIQRVCRVPAQPSAL